jgi:hypothetical protein
VARLKLVLREVFVVGIMVAALGLVVEEPLRERPNPRAGYLRSKGGLTKEVNRPGRRQDFKGSEEPREIV